MKLSSIDFTETELKHGYKPSTLSSSSHKLVVAVCEFCGSKYDVQFRRANGTCKRCNSVSSAYTVNNGGKTKEEFYRSMIEKIPKNVLSAIPDGVGLFSSKPILVQCEFCKNKYRTTPNTISKSGSIVCKSCIGMSAAYAKSGSADEKQAFREQLVEENKKKVNSVMDIIDIELTKEKFGIDATSLPWWSKAKIMAKCYFCGCVDSTSMIYLVKNSGVVSCSVCVGKKTKKTIFEKYGVESPTDIPSTRSKLSDPYTERLIGSILSSYGVPFERNYSVGPYSFDFFVPSHGVLIECQGDFFHHFKDNGYRGTPKDAAKATYVERHTNFELISIWEHEIHIGRIKTILRRFITEDQEEYSLSDLTISQIGQNEACVFLSQYHYLGELKSVHHFGAHVNGRLVAVASFGPTTRQTTAPKLSKHLHAAISYGEVSEIRRFCILPGKHPKNMASFLLKRFVDANFLLNRKIKIVLGFSDSSVGHNGGIYKASGWTCLWETSCSYHYLDTSTNKSIHKKTVYERASNLKMKEAEFVAMSGLVKVKEGPKTAWVKVFCPTLLPRRLHPEE